MKKPFKALSCAAALAAIETIEKENLLNRSTVIGRRFEERFSATRMAKDYVGVYRALLEREAAAEHVIDALPLQPALEGMN